MTVVLLAARVFAAAPSPAPAPITVQPMTPLALRSRLFGDNTPAGAPPGSGKPRVLNFWATWCGPCVAEIPQLVAYAKSHPNVDVVLVNLDLPKLRESHVVPFVRDHAVTHVTHLQLDHTDPAKGIRDVLPDFPDVVPITLVVDGSGTITQRYWRSLTEADISALP